VAVKSRIIYFATTIIIGLTVLVNVDRSDAEVDEQDSVNAHRLDVRCFYEVSRAFDSAVGLVTSVPDVQLPPPELRKVAHIPPTEIPHSFEKYPTLPSGGVGYFSNERGISVQSS